MIKIDIERVSGDYGFEAKDSYGNVVRMDTSPETGGQQFGNRPMQLLLIALGGCSGIDIISILRKQKQEVTGFGAHIEGDRQAGVEPSLWQHVKLVFNLKGTIDFDKAKRACELSMNKYCSVAETLRLAGCELTWEVRVNEEKGDKKPANIKEVDDAKESNKESDKESDKEDSGKDQKESDQKESDKKQADNE